MKKKRQKALQIIDNHRTNVIDITGDSVVFEIIGSSDNIDNLIDELSPLGLDGVSRTGVAAGFRGEKKAN